MKVTLQQVGAAIKRDRFLIPAVPRDDLGAGTEALLQLADMFECCSIEVEVPGPTLAEISGTLTQILEAPEKCPVEPRLCGDEKLSAESVRMLLEIIRYEFEDQLMEFGVTADQYPKHELQLTT